MKPSYYNIFLNPSNKYFVFNSFSGAMIELNDKCYKSLKSGQYNNLSNEEIDIAIKQGILVEDDYDEKAILKYTFNKSRYCNDTLAITIAPTLNCNFSCPYCYEKDIMGKMSTKIWDAILKYIIKNGEKYNTINLTFYGGEPLLETRSILRFLKAFADNDQPYS